MARKQKAILYSIALIICAESVLADRNDTLNRMIRKYSEQEIVCLDIDEEYPFKLKDGSEKVIRLISVREYRDSVLGQIRQADVNVRVNGKLLQLVCTPYAMPTEIEGIRIQADTTSAWMPLPKRAQFSIWDAKDPIIHTKCLGFPIRDYLLFSHGIQAYNEIVHLGWKDGCPEGVSFHHNYGIDFAGYEGKPIEVDFGDGTIVEHYASYSEIRHNFKSRGIHIVTASSTIDGKPIMQKQKVIVGQDKL